MNHDHRTHVICHMTISLDGKVTGEHLSRDSHSPASGVYYELNRNFKADGFACGRVTMEGSFTGGWHPDLSGYQPVQPDPVWMDCMFDDMEPPYAVAFDPHGHRIGYGGGFYDKFLEKEPNHPTLALCYEFQMLPYLETEPHDILVDCVLWA